MKNSPSLSARLFAAAAPLLLCLTHQACAAPAGVTTPAKAMAAQMPKALTNTIPVSVFVIPTNPKEGRDPFFPNSQRFASSDSSTNAAPVSVSNLSSLTLQGISGSADRRLAIVNGRTLAEGEETEISMGSDHVRFRCVEIKTDSVIIEAPNGNDRRELRLRSGF